MTFGLRRRRTVVPFGGTPSAAGICTAAGAADGVAGAGLNFAIRTRSSPSVTSSSAMPESATKSINVLSFRRSMAIVDQGVGVAFNAKSKAYRYPEAPSPTIVPTARSARYDRWRKLSRLCRFDK